jgi:hypothetical protein
MVFSAHPEACRQLGFLPTFRLLSAGLPGFSANFSADIQGALTANLEYLK